MIRKKPITEYCVILPIDDAIDPSNDADAVAKYYATLDESRLNLRGKPTRFKVAPLSFRQALEIASEFKLDVSGLTKGGTPSCDDLLKMSLALQKTAASCLKAVENYDGYTGSVDEKWAEQNADEETLTLLGMEIVRRAALEETDAENF